MSASCGICGGERRPRFPKVLDPHSKETFAIDGCVRCGHGVTVPAPIDLGPYYPEVYYGGRHGFTHRHCFGRRLSWLQQAEPTPGRLLDVGGGDGSFVEMASGKGWSATAVERNPEPLRARGLQVVTDMAAAGDLGPFEAITMWHSLEHFTDLDAVLASIRNLLSARGRLIVAVPRASSFQAKVAGRHWLHLDVPRHLHHFSDASLTHLLENHGLSVQRVWRHEYEYDLMGWVQSLSNGLLPTKNLFFDIATGRAPADVGGLAKTVAIALGMMLLPLAAPVTALEALFNRSGTLVVQAQLNRP